MMKRTKHDEESAGRLKHKGNKDGILQGEEIIIIEIRYNIYTIWND